MMKPVLAATAVVAFIGWNGTAMIGATQETWTGTISDSMCGTSHKAMAQQVNYTDAQCTLACVESGGKYVFVTDGKVLAIANQDFAGLKEHAAHTVKVTGEKKGEAIVVSKIEMSPKSN
jgi:hypothetical protein